MQEAYVAATDFDWSRYFPPNPDAGFLPVPENAESVSGDGDDACTRRGDVKAGIAMRRISESLLGTIRVWQWWCLCGVLMGLSWLGL